ncbi:MAG: hypothetical protein KKA62_01915 [Nanoarchaeota archaeon]|nr:hypothetical protein [Nanoarchaeota archaeon]MBU1644566.1 hypothetical protein [Nanoarchaeota archaeon]MBU1976690.1 hypothetical protein [Nanoarchaeota archaeon]
MKIIIIDTNALIAIDLFKIDVFEELDKISDFPYQLNVLRGTLDELNKIFETQRGKFKRAAKLALKILEAKKVKVLEEKGYVDDILVDHSKKGALILTQDIALKKRLKKPYLTIRQGKKIFLVN